MRASDSTAAFDAPSPLRMVLAWGGVLLPYLAKVVLARGPIEPHVVALFFSASLLVVVTMRRAASDVRLFPICGALVSAGALAAGTDYPIRVYPALLTGLAASRFAVSLRPGCVPLVQRFAEKLETQPLHAVALRYCRAVTWVWTVVLGASTLVALASWWISEEFWMLYNGAVSYLIFAFVFVTEYCVRRHVKARYPFSSDARLLDDSPRRVGRSTLRS